MITARLGLACLLAALTTPVAAADPAIGRLFFTPSQRTSLDIARSQRTRATVATEQTQEVVQPVPQTITYDGVVRRSDGQSTVFINNRPVHGPNTPDGGPTIVRRVGPDGSVTLEVPQSSRQVDLKVGQSVEVLSGSIGDSYRKQTPDANEKPSATGPSATTPATTEAPASRDTDRQRSSVGQNVPDATGAATAGSR